MIKKRGELMYQLGYKTTTARLRDIDGNQRTVCVVPQKVTIFTGEEQKEIEITCISNSLCEGGQEININYTLDTLIEHIENLFSDIFEIPQEVLWVKVIYSGETEETRINCETFQ